MFLWWRLQWRAQILDTKFRNTYNIAYSTLCCKFMCFLNSLPLAHYFFLLFSLFFGFLTFLVLFNRNFFKFIFYFLFLLFQCLFCPFIRYFYYIIVRMEWNILGVTCSTVKKYLLYKRKLLELRLVQNLKFYVEVYLRDRDFTCSMPIYIFINKIHC